MGNTTIEKVYDLQVIGGPKAYGEVDRLTKRFEDLKNIKIALNQQAANSKDSEEIKRLTEELKKIQKEYVKLEQEIAQLKIRVKELMELQASQARREAQATRDAVANAKIKTETEKQVTESERQGLIRLQQEQKALTIARQKDLAAKKANAATNSANALPGSYNDVARQYKELLALSKNVTILKNPVDVRQATEELMRLKSQLDNFNRSLTQDKVLIGEYTTGVTNAFRKMGLGSLIREQVNTGKASLETLNIEFERLKNELKQIQATGVGSLGAVERMLIENRQAAMQLTGQLETMKAEMGGIGTNITSAIGKQFANLKQQFVGFVSMYFGFMQIISGIHRSIRLNYELSDSFSDIKNRVHGTDEDVQKLVGSLRQLETRTNIPALVDIASIVAKKGVAKEEIAGITQALDNLFIVLGHEIGDPHEAVASLVKLINVYSEDKHVTADNIERIGGAIAKLTTSGVATGQFLIDFAERMAGVRSITGLSIESVLGFGASLEELGQSAEVSSTATSQVLVRLFTNYQHYADLTGLSYKEFLNRLKTDALGTFVFVAEHLKGNTKEMQVFFEEMQDMHLKGARALGVSGDVAGNADYVIKRMKDARDAIRETGLTAQLAANKQDNFAASIDRLKKSFDNFLSSKGVLFTLESFVGLIGLIIKLLPAITYGAILWGTAHAILNAQLIATKIQLIAVNAWSKAYALTMGLVTGSINAARWATLLWTEALYTSPIGAIAGTLAVLAGGIVALTYALSGNGKALKAQTQQELFSIGIQEKAAETAVATTTKIKTLTAVIKDNAIAEEVRAKALKELIAINPQYLEGLTIENMKTAEGAKLIDDYVQALDRKAKAEAAQSLLTDKNKELLKLTATELSLEEKKKAGITSENALTDEEKKYLPSVFDKEWYTRKSDLERAISGIRKRRQELTQELNILNDLAKKSAVQVLDASGHERYKGEIEEEINQVKELRSHFKEGSKEYKQYTEELNDLVKEWVGAGGRMPDAIAKKIAEAKQQLGLNRGNEVQAGVFRNQIKDLRKEMQNTLQLLDFQNIKRADRYRSVHDYFAAIQAAHKKETELMARALEEQLKQEMNAQKEIFENEQNSLQQRLTAYAIYAKDMKLLEEIKAGAELKIVQDKLNQIAAIEAAAAKKPKERTAEEKKMFDKRGRLNVAEQDLLINKDALTLEMDNIKATIETKEQQMARDINKSITSITNSGMEQILKEMDEDLSRLLKDISEKALEQSISVYDNNSLSSAQKRKKLDKISRNETTEADQAEADSNAKEQQAVQADIEDVHRQESHNQYMLGVEMAYQLKLLELKRKGLDLQAKIKEDHLKDEEIRDARQKEINDQLKNQSISMFQQIGAEYFQMLQRQNELQETNARKAMDWNKKKLDSQVQSNQQKTANDRAYALAQEQLDKDRVRKNKEIAKKQMALDYAVGVMKIWGQYNKGDLGISETIETAGLTAVYFAKLAFMDKYGQGGEVPSGGGVFGGNSHSNGGTRFAFKGRTFEAEADELAIINKRSAGSNQRMTVSGTPKQIASGINAWGGGYDFAPGAVVHKYEYGGSLGAQVQPPAFVNAWYANKMQPGNSGDQSGIREVYELVKDNVAAMNSLKDHVHSIQVYLNPNAVAAKNNETYKTAKLGTIRKNKN